MKVGCINFANTAPFFFNWDEQQFPLVKNSPYELGEAAKRGEIIGGHLPITLYWELEEEFEPLGNWGIAAKKNVNSVFLLSRKPIWALTNVTVGLTPQSQTSIQLLRLVLMEKYGHQVILKPGLSDDNDAWLVIGDQALKFWNRSSPQWPIVTDLAHEWWTWKKKPFVFARWIVRKDVEAGVRQKLMDHVDLCLKHGLASLHIISDVQSKKLGLPHGQMQEYLKGFIYEFGSAEEESSRLFRALIEKMDKSTPAKISSSA